MSPADPNWAPPPPHTQQGVGDFLSCWLTHHQEEPGFSGNWPRMARAQVVWAGGKPSEPVWALSALINQSRKHRLLPQRNARFQDP